MARTPDTYRYPAEDLDKDFYVQLVSAWVQSRMEADRALLQLNGFLLAAVFVVLTNNKDGQLGPQEGWVFVAAILGVAAAMLVAVLKQNAELLEHHIADQLRRMTAKHNRPIESLIEPTPVQSIGEQTHAPAPLPTSEEVVADLEQGLAALDSLILAMLTSAGLLAGALMIHKVF